MSRIVELPPDEALYPDGAKPGGWWRADEEQPDRVICELCPRACVLRPGDRGFCFVRENREGKMVLGTYGRSTGFCIDPIEKKPLNHFFPGTSVLSFGTAGCNLGCKFCQNWSISKSREIEQLSEEATPEAIAAAAQRLGCRSVAFTYNDPVVWAEYAIDAARACRAAGVKTVAVTAGYISPAARGPFFEFIDAANVDLKGFTEDFYRHVTLSHLAPVLDTLRWLKRETDVWFEITNLVIPQANDSLDEIRQMCQWIVDELGADVPLHFTAFHPDFRMTDRGRTPAETLLAARDVARSLGLNYVYVGNVHAPRDQSTFCPQCGGLLIERDGYEIGAYGLAGDRCGHCRTPIAGRFDASPGHWGSRRQPVRIAEFAPRTLHASLPVVQPNQPQPATPTLPMNVSTPSVPSSELSPEHEQAVLRAAGRVVAAAARGEPHAAGEELAPFSALIVGGAFVTLKREGRLRSCCGTHGQGVPLPQAIAHAAMRAANDDPRFPPISPTELAHLEIEVSLLEEARPVLAQGAAKRDAVVVGKHGLQIARGEARGLLLPVVAVEHKLDAEAFLQHVCMKAGLPPTAWKEDDVALSTFEGRAIGGRLAEVVEFPDAERHALPIAPADVAALADFALSNLQATVAGATPSFYAFGMFDGNVSGLAAVLRNAEGAVWLQASKVSLRQGMPLQATLFRIVEELARSLLAPSLLAGGVGAEWLAGARLELVVLYDPAMHGALATPDLRGFDPRRRALLILEAAKSSLAFAADLAAGDLLRRAAEQVAFAEPEAASVFSLAAVANAAEVFVSHAPRPRAGATIRPAAMAGKFYPADRAALDALLDELLSGPACAAGPWRAAMAPHAGLRYSGRVAAETLRRIEIPETVIVLGPKHTPHGVEWAVAPHRAWSLPGGTLAADPELAQRLARAIPGLQLDAAAHAEEHAIEVELPFLHRLAPEARVVGIAIGGGSLARCRQFAAGLAECLRGERKPPLLLVSSDMNHFASDEENRRLDEIALAALETLDPERLYETVAGQHISMCGLLPAVIVLETLRRLGQLHRAERVAYSTSADATGDRRRVVGYAGMLFE
ncbi:MAG TPA: AmmeMemoRadiSam system radical SAM enzyme [Pirellulales bacterium]|nr:AmmeMemoRadiSam system radical SAM enzyme [Pirellulales bacterium]